MIPSLSSDYFDDKSPEEALELLVGAGWREIEFSNTHTDHLLARADPVRAAETFRARAADLGVRFVQSHLPLEPDLGRDDGPDRDKSIDKLKRSLDVLGAVGARYCMHHVGRLGFMDQADSPERVWEGRISGLSELVDHAGPLGLTVCVENGIAPTEIDETLRIIADCGQPDNLGICLDTGHLNVASGEVGDFILRAGSLLKALHLHDNDGTRDQHLFPYSKTGTVRWREVVPALHKIGYEGLFNFEVSERNSPLPIRLAKLRYLRELAEIMLADTT